MPVYNVTDTVFEAAVDADLYERATRDQITLLHADPHAWRAALAARSWVIEALKNNCATLPMNTAVHDKDGSIRTFTNEASRRSMQQFIRLKSTVQLRVIHAKQLSRELAADLDAYEAASLNRIVAYATTIVPQTDTKFWSMVNTYCERHRNGVAFNWKDKS